MNRRVWACAVLLGAFWTAAAAGEDWFAPAARVADYKPKGPTHCFRQFNIDWSWISLRPEQLPEFFSQADPVALAEFCARTRVDGTVAMAVPHHGYCTYKTRVGTMFPSLKDDWFGRTIEELHKRRVAAFGYVTLNWNWKFIRENFGRDFIHGRPDAHGVFSSRGMICLNAPGYLELVEAYTREVLENYPVDGMRWDILMTAKGCTCVGCKAFYRQLYGQELADWGHAPAGRVDDFYMATTGRVVTRLRQLCKRIKPSVEIWQNCLQSYHPNHLDLARDMDIAYNEFGDPFRLLLIRGVADKGAVINGLMNHTPAAPPRPLDRQEWRTCLALGGRCYSYYGHKQTDPRSVLPGPAMLAWHRDQLAPFYQMVERIEPYLADAEPVSHVGVVFSERTRFRFAHYDRKTYVDSMEPIVNGLLRRSLPLEFVNVLDLGDPRKRLDRFKLLVLPLTAGLLPEETACLRGYVERGGRLLVAGDALRHDPRGRELADFALAREMGVSYRAAVVAPSGLPIAGSAPLQTPPRARIKNLVQVRPVAGQTVLSASWQGEQAPLLHLNSSGKGRLAFLASLDSPDLTVETIQWLAGPAPAAVGQPDKQVILAAQAACKRWILHLISGGDYTVDLAGRHVPVTKVTDRYPAAGWDYRLERRPEGLRIHVSGAAEDRLLVLQ